MRLIHSDTCIAEGVEWLIRREPRFAVVAGPVALRLQPDGFAALMEMIVGQQVSTASAAAIVARLHGAGVRTEADVVAAGAEGLAACGLSRPKIRYILSLAQAGLHFPALRDLPDDAVIATLTAQPGIGRWTAEIYAIFALGRQDILPAGDLALRIAAGRLFGHQARSSEAELRLMAEAWAPWRAVAARLLFTYYRTITSREGIR